MTAPTEHNAVLVTAQHVANMQLGDRLAYLPVNGVGCLTDPG